MAAGYHRRAHGGVTGHDSCVGIRLPRERRVHGTTRAQRLDGIREDDQVTLQFAHPGDNPTNPFQQPDGRPYDSREVIVASMERGDWLESS